MHENKPNPDTPAVEPAAPADGVAAAPAGGEGASTTTPEAGGACPHPPQQTTESAELTALKAEAADLRDRLLRAHAEMDNLRKRTEREKADAHKYAVTKFARDIVTVGDNFQRAVDAVPADAADKDPVLKSFLDGVTLTGRELLNVLERNGIKRIDPKGEPFNPHYHQAVMEMPSPDVPSGTVTQVFQPGYMIDDRILRPAMVVVAKGGMKPPAASTPAADVHAPTQAQPPAPDEAGDGASPREGDTTEQNGSRAGQPQ